MQTMTCLLAGNWRAGTRCWGSPLPAHADPHCVLPAPHPAVVYASFWDAEKGDSCLKHSDAVFITFDGWSCRQTPGLWSCSGRRGANALAFPLWKCGCAFVLAPGRPA